MAIQSITKGSQSNDNSKDSEKNFILKVMEDEFGYTAAHSILTHVSRVTMKSKSEILSDYDEFARIMKDVYTEEVAEKEILDRLSNFGLKQKM